MGKLLKRLGLGVVAAVLLGVVTFSTLVATGTLPYKVYVIHTGSMYPTFPVETAVIVREHQYHIGQPVSFMLHPGGTVLTHRLVAINAEGIITTKGDANKTVDPWHEPKSDIIGGVVAAVPMVGYLIVFLRDPMGSASIVLSIASFWLLWSIVGDFEHGEPRRSRAHGAAIPAHVPVLAPSNEAGRRPTPLPISAGILEPTWSPTPGVPAVPLLEGPSPRDHGAGPPALSPPAPPASKRGPKHKRPRESSSLSARNRWVLRRQHLHPSREPEDQDHQAPARQRRHHLKDDRLAGPPDQSYRPSVSGSASDSTRSSLWN